MLPQQKTDYPTSVFTRSLLSLSWTLLPTYHCPPNFLQRVFGNAFKLQCGGRRVKLKRCFSNKDGFPKPPLANHACVLSFSVVSSTLYSFRGFPWMVGGVAHHLIAEYFFLFLVLYAGEGSQNLLLNFLNIFFFAEIKACSFSPLNVIHE